MKIPQKLGNKDEKKNNYKDIWNDKLSILTSEDMNMAAKEKS